MALKNQTKKVLVKALAEQSAADDLVNKIDAVIAESEDTAGRVAANQADSVAVDLAALIVDFNALLAKLKAAGLMVDDE